MRRWAVTGPAGGGKSALCGFLAGRGAAVVDGDLLGHEVLAREDVLEEIVSEFGYGVVACGAVDRRALGGLVFADPAALKRLNRITHRPLAALADKRLAELEKEGRHQLAVFEAAVYFLLPPVPGIELVISVTAPESVRLIRLTERSGLSDEAARRRIAAQSELEVGWAGADVVLANDGPLADLASAAEKLWSRLKD